MQPFSKGGGGGYIGLCFRLYMYAMGFSPPMLPQKILEFEGDSESLSLNFVGLQL